MEQRREQADPSVPDWYPPNRYRSPHIELPIIRACLAIRIEVTGNRLREIWFRLRMHLSDTERKLLVEEQFTLEEKLNRLTSELLVIDDFLKEAIEGDWSWEDCTEDMVIRRIQQKRELLEEQRREFEYTYSIGATRWPQ